LCSILPLLACVKDTHEASITIIEYDLIKQNESSLGIMKWDLKHE